MATRPRAVLMNIIIVGAGEIGRHLATELSREAQSIAVIETDPRLAAELERSIDGKVICADGSSVHALAQAFGNDRRRRFAQSCRATGRAQATVGLGDITGSNPVDHLCQCARRGDPTNR